MRRKIAFVYNLCMNLVAFVLVFPSEVGASSLYWEEVFPQNLPALEQQADKLLNYYHDRRLVIKDSNSYQRNWIFAEYALEQARLTTIARALTLSPAQIYCERASGRVWLDICLAHLLPSEVLLPPAHFPDVLANSLPQSAQAPQAPIMPPPTPAIPQNYDQSYEWSSPNAYSREFNHSLWSCYYQQDYALYRLNMSFYYLQFGVYQEKLFTRPEEHLALLLSSPCLNTPGTNLSQGFKVFLFGWERYGCNQATMAKAALDYLANNANKTNGLELGENTPAPQPCGKILGYMNSAGLADTHEDKIVRHYSDAWTNRRYPYQSFFILPRPNSLCE